MKEILYLDIKLVNSYLAQLDEGLVSKMSNSSSQTKQESEETSTTNVSAADGGINVGVANSKLSTSEQNTEKENLVYSSSNTSLMDTVLDDFSLDILIKNLSGKELIQSISNNELSEGAFLLHTGSFQIIDFEMLEHTMRSENVNLFNNVEIHNSKIDAKIDRIKEISPGNKNNKAVKNKEIETLKSEKLPPDPAFENFNHAHRFGKFGNVLYPQSCLFKIDNLLAMSSNSNIRVNKETLSLFNSTDRKITILGTVISKRRKKLLEKNDDGTIKELEAKNIASSAQLIFSEIILDSLKLSEVGDYFIRPIAIYFD